MSIAVATYRVFCRDGGRTVEQFELDADDDREALALLALQQTSSCELWRGARLIATIPEGANPLWVNHSR